MKKWIAVKPFVSIALIICAVLALTFVAASQDTQSTQTADSSPQKLELEGVDNVFRLSKTIISGACPVGEAGFSSLRDLGVKTIITVDGAKPDLELAQKFGMRYVHLPIGYNGLSRERQLEIGRAVRDLPGPVFIHCHHGKHRGPTVAVVAAMISEGWTTQQAVSTMKIVGTSPTYTGLYDTARAFQNPTKDELNEADATFPATASVPDLAMAMVEIDERWEHLKDVRAAGWKVPKNHPDIDPPHEALLLQEDFRELLRAPDTKARPEDYRRWLKENETAAAALQAALRSNDGAKAEAAYQEILANCDSCHIPYRNATPVKN